MRQESDPVRCLPESVRGSLHWLCQQPARVWGGSQVCGGKSFSATWIVFFFNCYAMISCLEYLRVFLYLCSSFPWEIIYVVTNLWINHRNNLSISYSDITVICHILNHLRRLNILDKIASIPLDLLSKEPNFQQLLMSRGWSHVMKILKLLGENYIENWFWPHSTLASAWNWQL